MTQKRLALQVFCVFPFLLAGCAARPSALPSVITADVAATLPTQPMLPTVPTPPREDMMSPIVIKDVLSNIDALEKTFDWKPFRPGVEIARIYNTPDGGPSAAFLR